MSGLRLAGAARTFRHAGLIPAQAPTLRVGAASWRLTCEPLIATNEARQKFSGFHEIEHITNISPHWRNFQLFIQILVQ